MPYLVAPLTFVLEVAGAELASFARCSGIGSESEVVEFTEGGEPRLVRKVPGRTRWADLVLERPFDGTTTLWEWRREVLEGDVGSVRRDGSVVVRDPRQGVVARWDFRNGWPSAHRVRLDVGPGEAAVEELVVCHEGLRPA